VPPQDGQQTSLLVYGASSSVGVYVTQLAKKLGLFVVGVVGASAQSAGQFGGDLVLNDKSSNFLADLANAIQLFNVHRIFDAVAEGGTTELTAATVDAISGPNFMTTLLPVANPASLPGSFNFSQTSVSDLHNPGKAGAQEFGARLAKLAGEWLESGELKPPKVTVIPGGLGSVGEAIARLQDGKVSAGKLVYRIGEIPDLA